MEYKCYRVDVQVHDRAPQHITATYAINDREGRRVIAGVVAGGFDTTDEARREAEVRAFDWIDKQGKHETSAISISP